MSSPITLNANEPVRAPAERVRRGGMVERGGQTVGEPERARPVIETAKTAKQEAPELKDAVKMVQNFVSDMQRELQFSVDEDSGRTIIRVIDSDSGKIIRQIPPEELLQIARSVTDGGNINLIKSRV